MIELLRALESGGGLGSGRVRAKPLIERNPVLFWQGTSALLAAALAAALILR